MAQYVTCPNCMRKVKRPEEVDFKTIIKLLADEVDKVNKICQDIKSKDPSFDFEIKNNVLTLFSKTEKEAFSRGCWFREKALGRNIYFKIAR